MRCKFCGSRSLHPDSKHKTFSAGKAVAGTAVLGVYGAAAGLIGKDIKGYSCGECMAFSEAAMPFSIEDAINKAISKAENGDYYSYEYFRKQYYNIERIERNKQTEISNEQTQEKIRYVKNISNNDIQNNDFELKNTIVNNAFIGDSPMYIDEYRVLSKNKNDYLQIIGFNCSEKSIRSAYFDVVIFDDTGDKIGEEEFVFQGLNLGCKEALPKEYFELNQSLSFSVKVVLKKVAFTDNEVWRNENSNVIYLKESCPIDPYFSRLKYLKGYLSSIASVDDEEIFYPIVEKEYWKCVCGRAALLNERCSHCGLDIDEIQYAMSQETLETIQKKSVMDRAIVRAKETVQLREDAFDSIYSKAVSVMNKKDYRKAKSIFNSIISYKDSKEKIEECDNEIQRMIAQKEEEMRKKQEEIEEKKRLEKLQEEEKKKKQRRIKKLISVIVAITVVLLVLFICGYSLIVKKIIPDKKYNQTVELMKCGDYSSAIEDFTALNGYKDSPDLIDDCHYQIAIGYLQDLNYSDALKEASLILNEDKKNYCKNEILTSRYDHAVLLFDSKQYEDAYSELLVIRFDFDTDDMMNECKYNLALEKIEDGDYLGAYSDFVNLGDYEDSSYYKDILKKPYLLSSGAYGDKKVGDTFVLGSFEQDDDSSNGKEPIEWIVFKNTDGYILAVSKNSLFMHTYSSNAVSCWKDSSLRTYLNGPFLTSAFTEEEQLVVGSYETSENVYDYVSIPSIAQHNTYAGFGGDLKKCYASTSCFNDFVGNRDPSSFRHDLGYWLRPNDPNEENCYKYEDHIEYGYIDCPVRPMICIEYDWVYENG
ncbi:MAG: hypothetical protein MJ166_09230 [Clostridia bacterium]|nr:hypothetical protein [Clostridia bacterium]